MKPTTHAQSVQERYRYLMVADPQALKRRQQCILMRGLQQIDFDTLSA
ncbi:MAG: hypothetical protein JOZ78_15615 [Chroococcidiopsidaceae cyanobacterium CP_BM_ER_R8_30]|nr:hypothetical protein [Chroococcidiopsidaceae cyanobacterium CP_BM_ER_R8_30]